MNNIRNLILDMDGVLWRGETPLPDLPGFFARLDALGIRSILATNNATRTARLYTEKLARFGVTMPAERIVTSSEATATYLRRRYPAGTRVYVVGEEGLHEALTAQGFDILNRREYDPQTEIPLVVAGFNRHATYRELAGAVLYINQGAHFVGTNPDVTFPSELGQLPGAGATLAFIAAAAGVEPEVIGKPGPILFQEALQRLGATNGAATAMVGDRLSTDIAGAQNVGLATVLVLSGVTSREELAAGSVVPDLVFADIHALADHLTTAAR